MSAFIMTPEEQTEHAREIIRAMDAAEIGPTDALRIISIAMQQLAHGFDMLMDRVEPRRADA